MPNISARKSVGSERKPSMWYLTYLDGQVWEFHEGTDFNAGQAQSFRNKFHSFVYNYNKSVGSQVYQLHTSITTADDGHKILLIQSTNYFQD